MPFSNFAVRYHKDIDHGVIYQLKNVCDVVPCGVVVHVNVNFDTHELHDRVNCGCSCGKMSG